MRCAACTHHAHMCTRTCTCSRPRAGQREHLLQGPLLQLRHRLLGHPMQGRVRCDLGWFRGLQRQVQGRRLLQGPPRPRHQTVDAPLPPRRPVALLPLPSTLRTYTPASLPPHPLTLRRPHFTTHSCDTQSDWDECNRVHGDVKDVVSVRAAHPRSRIPLTPPQLQTPRPTHIPHTSKPTQHAITHLNPTCQHTRARSQALLLPPTDEALPTPARLNRGLSSSSLASRWRSCSLQARN